MDLVALCAHVKSLVATQPILATALGNGTTIYAHTAATQPSITLSGFARIGDKTDQHYTFNLHLTFKSTGAMPEKTAFYANADRLSEALEASEIIEAGDWLDRPEQGFNRVLFPCEVWF